MHRCGPLGQGVLRERSVDDRVNAELIDEGLEYRQVTDGECLGLGSGVHARLIARRRTHAPMVSASVTRAFLEFAMRLAHAPLLFVIALQAALLLACAGEEEADVAGLQACLDDALAEQQDCSDECLQEQSDCNDRCTTSECINDCGDSAETCVQDCSDDSTSDRATCDALYG